jgi:hypothetical protein
MAEHLVELPGSSEQHSCAYEPDFAAACVPGKHSEKSKRYQKEHVLDDIQKRERFPGKWHPYHLSPVRVTDKVAGGECIGTNANYCGDGPKNLIKAEA